MLTDFEVYPAGYGEKLYGSNLIDTIIPPRGEIPQNFFDKENSWNHLATEWFREGLSKDIRFTPKVGIRKDDAISHLKCLLNSKYTITDSEYLIAGAAFLISLWFKNVEVIEEIKDDNI